MNGDHPIDRITFESLLDMRRELEAKLGPAPPEVVEVDGLEPGAEVRVDMPRLWGPVAHMDPERRETRPVMFVGRTR